jgi:NAD+ kinase
VAIGRIGLVTHTGRESARHTADQVRAWAADHDVPIGDMDVWDGEDGRKRLNSVDEATACGHPDLIVTVGGDGTFLRGARIAMRDNAAILGVNAGTLGFLTEVEPDGLCEALDQYHAGRYEIEERLTLTMRSSRPLEVPPDLMGLLRAGRGPLLPPPPTKTTLDDAAWGVPLDLNALNDVVFEKLARDRQAGLGLYLDGRLFASYSTDALVVGTSTGSTAYSFAAGGPVLSPRVEGLVVTPVAPHMIFNRSLVLAADEVVTVWVQEQSGPIAVTVDGQLRGVVKPGDWVAIYVAASRARIVRLQRADFFTRLRSRFALADAPAATGDELPPEYRPHGPIPEDIQRLFRV